MELLFAGLIKLLGSAGFGTVFGGVMGFFNRKADLAVKKLELEDRVAQRAHELAQREVDAKILEKEYAARVQVASVEAAGREAESAHRALEKSYDFARPARGSAMEGFSSFVRPFISLAYFAVSTLGSAFILHHTFSVEHVTFSTEQWYELAHFVVSWVAFMSGTTIGYWFAQRAGVAPQIGRKAS